MPDPQLMSTLLMLALMVAAFYFLLIRPAQRKQRQQQEMVSQLGPGSRVMTTSGVYGTIAQLGDRQAVIEIAPGVEMTVLKQAIMKAVDPADDEFVYDEVDAVDADDAALTDEVLLDETVQPLDGYADPTLARDEPTTYERPQQQ
ncbi:preprotein translocase subunit YajC [Propioniciclava soli]|uniref:Preprotein translocase subunit YajC n=1 Tax=Propioniciclava soli TaxID=2775081 RepID=A0ABZ3C2D7_9ACTN|nr:preprotein translocase subunit YajC [Propioniciclava soli]